MATTDDKAVTRQRKRAAATLGVLALFCAAFLAAAWALAPEKGVGEDGPPLAIEDILSDEEEAMESFYTLLIGSDSRRGTALYTGKANEHAQRDQHSDVMLLVRVDPATYTISLISIPRDTQLAGQKDKINDSLRNNNPEEVVAAAERLTGVSIQYYMMTNFIGFEQLVNDVGGVTVDVPLKVTVVDPSTGRDVTVRAGENQKLNGSQALVLARARKEYSDNQDIYRQANVRQIVESMIAKALADSQKTEDDVLALEEYVQTNFDFDMLLQLALDFQAHSEEVTIYSSTGPYEGGGLNESDLWVVPEDAEAWAELMAAVDAGEDPAEVIAPLAYGSDRQS